MDPRRVPLAALVVHVVGLVACGTKIAQTADPRPAPDDSGVVSRADSSTAFRDGAGDGASAASDGASEAGDGASDAGDGASDAIGDAPGAPCMTPTQMVVLPSEPQWGGGDTVPPANVLVSSAYG